MSMSKPWLTGWKDIANYIGRSVKTAQKYHFQHEMPVHLLPDGGRAALRSELDEWLKKWAHKLDEFNGSGLP